MKIAVVTVLALIVEGDDDSGSESGSKSGCESDCFKCGITFVLHFASSSANFDLIAVCVTGTCDCGMFSLSETYSCILVSMESHLEYGWVVVVTVVVDASMEVVVVVVVVAEVVLWTVLSPHPLTRAGGVVVVVVSTTMASDFTEMPTTWFS